MHLISVERCALANYFTVNSSIVSFAIRVEIEATRNATGNSMILELCKAQHNENKLMTGVLYFDCEISSSITHRF